MKQKIFWTACIISLLTHIPANAQSLKDLFSKENIEKVVGGITGSSPANMEGTWTFIGSAIEFESDNILQQAGGSVASAAAESKLNEQLDKIGIKKGVLSFTFKADSTFNVTLNGKKIPGSYTYNQDTKQVELKIVMKEENKHNEK